MNRTKHRSQDEVKKMRRGAYIKIVAAVGFFAAVLAYGTISWFTMNKENNASGMGVRVHYGLFELQTSGADSNYAYLLTDDSLGYTSGTRISDDVYRTDGTNAKLALMLTANNDPMNNGLQPRDSGTISFTIVPDSSYSEDTEHQLKVNYTISVKGYYLNSEKREAVMVYEEKIASGESVSDEERAAAEITFDDLNLIDGLTPGEGNNDIYLAARKLVNGHILFFDKYENNKYSNMIDFSESGEERVNLGSTKTVNINWIWPETFGDIIDNDNTVIAASYYDDMVDYITENEEYFFYNLNKAKIKGLEDDELTIGAVKDDDNYLPFSYGYNNADQIIGENVQFILIEISAEGTIVDKEED